MHFLAVVALFTLVLHATCISGGLSASRNGRKLRETLKSERGIVPRYSNDYTFGNSLQLSEPVPDVSITNLGGLAMSRPCCVNTGKGRVDCFIRGRRSNVLQKTVYRGKPGDADWTDIGGYAIGDLECVSRTTNSIEVFAVDDKNNLNVNSYRSNEWKDWNSLGWFAMEAPECVSLSYKDIYCVYRGYANTIYHVKYYDGRWSSPDNFLCQALFPLRCGTFGGKRIDCFSVVSDRLFYRVSYNKDKNWVESKFVKADINGPPSVIWADEHTLFAIGLGTDSEIQQTITYADAFDKLTASVSFGGIFDTSPECVKLSEDQIVCFAVSVDSQLYHNRWACKDQWHGIEWWGWKRDTDGTDFYIGPPTCIVRGVNEISCFVRNKFREIVQFDYSFNEITTAVSAT